MPKKTQLINRSRLVHGDLIIFSADNLAAVVIDDSTTCISIIAVNGRHKEWVDPISGVNNSISIGINFSDITMILLERLADIIAQTHGLRAKPIYHKDKRYCFELRKE